MSGSTRSSHCCPGGIGSATSPPETTAFSPLVEYETIRLSLIEKYGEEGKDERGQPTFVLKMESPNFKTFCDELAPFNKMTHEVELMTAKYSEAEGNLTGEEILAIDWMLED